MPSWFSSISEKLSVKADLAIYYLLSAWGFWIVHECVYHVHAKDEIQVLCIGGWFFKTQLLIPVLNIEASVAFLEPCNFYCSSRLVF